MFALLLGYTFVALVGFALGLVVAARRFGHGDLEKALLTFRRAEELHTYAGERLAAAKRIRKEAGVLLEKSAAVRNMAQALLDAAKEQP